MLSDSRGTEIKVGSKVAVNVSGDLGAGEVVAVSGRSPIIRVRLTHRVAGMPVGHITKIKRNPRSVLVLE